ncbi:uncharacterized protein LOC142161561 [Mixophyes fleayi]|uniref:uncharacterized protein LOC142161561 n=1 Tax=Mixophyes fleayi TaxID=3061075 RepID=UPI003F4DF548
MAKNSKATCAKYFACSKCNAKLAGEHLDPGVLCAGGAATPVVAQPRDSSIQVGDLPEWVAALTSTNASLRGWGAVVLHLRLVSTGVCSAYKCAGTDGNSEGIAVSTECFARKASSRSVRQCHGSVIHKQTRRHQECRSNEGDVSDFGLGQKIRTCVVSSFHPRNSELAGGLSKSAQSSSGRVGSSSRNFSVVGRQVGTSRSRSDGVMRKQKSSRVLRKRSTSSGGGCVNNAMGLQVRLPVSSHINDSQGTSESQAGRSASHSGDSSLATKSLVSRDPSYGSGSGYSVTPSERSTNSGTILASGSSQAEFNGMAFEASLWKSRGFSSRVVDTLIKARKPISAHLPLYLAYIHKMV